MSETYTYRIGERPAHLPQPPSVQTYTENGVETSYYELAYDATVYTADNKAVTIPWRQYRRQYDEDGFVTDGLTDTLPAALLDDEQRLAVDVAQYRKRMHDADLVAQYSPHMLKLALDEAGGLWTCQTKLGVSADIDHRVFSVITADVIGKVTVASAVYQNSEPEAYDQADISYFVPEEMSEANAYMFVGDNCTWRKVIGTDEAYRIADIALCHVSMDKWYR